MCCRMLGYSEALRYGTVPSANRGTGPIWMDNVNCNGTEESLDDCSFPGFGISDCSHYEDVYIVCNSECVRRKLGIVSEGGREGGREREGERL